MTAKYSVTDFTNKWFNKNDYSRKCVTVLKAEFLFLLFSVACSLFPPIMDEQERLSYKREFDRDHLEYKSLQAELDGINQDLADLEGDLDRHPEGSPHFLVRVAELFAV